MAFTRRIINCTTHEKVSVKLTPEEEAKVLAKEAEGIAYHAAEAEAKESRQAALDKLLASVDPIVMDLVKALGLDRGG